jgi:hypothetical protein
VIPADVHQPDEVALPAARNRKCVSTPGTVELLVVLLAGGLMPAFPVCRRLDEPGFQMKYARSVTFVPIMECVGRILLFLKLQHTQLFLMCEISSELL